MELNNFLSELKNVSIESSYLHFFENFYYVPNNFPLLLENENECNYLKISILGNEFKIFEKPAYYDTGTERELVYTKLQSITTEQIYEIFDCVFEFIYIDTPQIEFNLLISTIISFFLRGTNPDKSHI